LKLVTFEAGGMPRPGALMMGERTIADIQQLVPGINSLLDIVRGGPGIMESLRDAVANPCASAVFNQSDVRLLAPIPRPARNIFCVGKNYYEHAEEFHSSGYDASADKTAIPDCPIYFTKSYTTVIGPGMPIPASSDWTASVDYEVELTAVIGKGGRGISKADAYDHVFGYTIINDVTSRTLQQKHKQWFLGKNFDGFCPMGPWLVTSDEVGNINEITVSTEVNGELRQKANVKDLIFDVPTLVQSLSEVMTLEPGDLIATGTPAGVGLGFKPPKFLVPGDTVSVSVSRLGSLTNPVT